MSDWGWCYVCGFEKPHTRLTMRKINGRRRVVCDTCADDLDSGEQAIIDHGTGQAEAEPGETVAG